MGMENKKTSYTPWIVAALVLALATAGFFVAKRYYDNHYVAASSFYTMVPMNFDITPTQMYDNNGRPVDVNGVIYQMTAFNDQGESAPVEFTVLEGRNFYQPGQFLSVQLSGSGTVLGQSVVAENEVPASARALIG